MKSRQPSQDSFGALPDSESDTHDDSNGVFVPHAEDDPKDLQRVRDLLFGATSRAHSTRLEALESKLTDRIAALEKDFEQRSKELESQMRAELKSDVLAISSRLDDHGTRKMERADLRSMLAELADRIGD